MNMQTRENMWVLCYSI